MFSWPFGQYFLKLSDSLFITIEFFIRGVVASGIYLFEYMVFLLITKLWIAVAIGPNFALANFDIWALIICFIAVIDLLKLIL